MYQMKNNKEIEIKSKKNKISDAIEKMVKELIYNREKRNSGFPISSALLDRNFELISSNVNSKANDKITDFKNHAEYKCYTELENKDEEIICFVTIPPCNDCFDAIFKNKKTYLIYYFFDDIRRKSNRKYLKENKKNIIKIKNNRKSSFSINTKYNIYYVIMCYLEGILTQSIDEYSKKIAIGISRNKIQNLKIFIKNDNPSKNEIKINEVWKMIEKAKKINPDNIFHRSDDKKNFEWII